MNDYDRQDLIKQRAGLEPPAHEGDYWSDEDRARLKCQHGFWYQRNCAGAPARRACYLPTDRANGPV